MVHRFVIDRKRSRPDPRLIQRVALDSAPLQMQIAERDLRVLDHGMKVGR